VLPGAFGLEPGSGENLLVHGDMAFDLFGPRNRLAQESMAAGLPLHEWFGKQCERGSLAPDGRRELLTLPLLGAAAGTGALILFDGERGHREGRPGRRLHTAARPAGPPPPAAHAAGPRRRGD
jgi:hypothetical protein